MNGETFAEQIREYLLAWAEDLPLELFALAASFAEEIIVFIPSPLVTILVGSLGQLQGYGWYIVPVLVACSVAGKLLGALALYYIADKGQDYAAKKFVRLSTLEDFGKRLKGGWRDVFILAAPRALPFFPNSAVSIASGFFKVPMNTYVISTVLGYTARDIVYVTIGYVGLATTRAVINEIAAVHVLFLLLIIAAVAILGYVWYHRGSTTTPPLPEPPKDAV